MPVPAALRHPLFLGSALLYGSSLLNKRWLHWPLPTALTSYLGDVLFLPLALSVALAAHQLAYGRAATLPGAWGLAAWAGVALWFEGLLPLWSPQSVADPWDVLAYGVGAAVFYKWLNK